MIYESCNSYLCWVDSLSFHSTERNTSERFIFIEQMMNWSQAQSYCRETHTDLVSGRQQTTDQQLKNLSQIQKLNDGQENNQLFIGLFKDIWGWSDGSSSSFRNWKFLNDKVKKINECATTTKDGTWKADNCTEPRSFFCYDGESLHLHIN